MRRAHEPLLEFIPEGIVSANAEEPPKRTSRKRHRIERLAEVLLPSASGERYLAMLSAYLDESGKGNERKRFLAVGCLVSSALQWVRLEKDWNACLLAVPGMPILDGEPVVPFHMTDFEVGKWPMEGYQWPSPQKKDAFLNRLVAIICNRVRLRVYTAVYLEHYHLLFPGDKKYETPWVLSALGCAHHVSKWAIDKTKDNVPFIFEAGGEGWRIAP